MDLCKTAPVFKLSIPDGVKAVIVAAISAPVGIMLDTLNTGTLTFDWKKITVAALTGGLSYLAKNFLTGANGQLLSNGKPKEVGNA
jgi:hypothetical protein